MAGGIWKSVQGGKEALLLEKGVERVSDILMEEWMNIMYWIGKW